MWCGAVYGLGARNAVIGVAKKFEGTASVEFSDFFLSPIFFVLLCL